MLLKVKDETLNFPDILILGAAKSGTTSLAFYLKQHPDVLMPRKEPGFFAYHDRPKEDIPSGIRARQIVDLDEYTNMYKKVRADQKICDASVAQFTNHTHTIRNARKYYGSQMEKVNAFILLRHPVERAFSHYLMFVKNGLESLPFETAIEEPQVSGRIGEQLGFDYLGGSKYADRVRDFKKAFPGLKVYLMDDLRNQDDFLQEFLEHCELRTDVAINTSVRLNPSGIPKKRGLIQLLHRRTKIKSIVKKVLPDNLQFRMTAIKSGLIEKSIDKVKIDIELKDKLIQNHFKEDILSLENLIDRDLSHWLTTKH